MEDSKNNGFHITEKALRRNPKYLNKDNEFVHSAKALLFLDQKHAENYVEANKKLDHKTIVIVPCTCFDFIRADHPIANVDN